MHTRRVIYLISSSTLLSSFHRHIFTDVKEMMIICHRLQKVCRSVSGALSTGKYSGFVIRSRQHCLPELFSDSGDALQIPRADNQYECLREKSFSVISLLLACQWHHEKILFSSVPSKLLVVSSDYLCFGNEFEKNDPEGFREILKDSEGFWYISRDSARFQRFYWFHVIPLILIDSMCIESAVSPLVVRHFEEDKILNTI